MSFSELTEAVDGNLDELIRSYAVVSVRPARLAVATTVVESGIYTWNVYRDVEVLSRVPPEPGVKCLWSHPPPDVKLGTGEIAMPSGGGSATVDGVDVRMTTNQWFPQDYTRRYLVFAVLCSGQVMVLPLNGRAAFEVDERGALSTAPSAASFRFQYQAEELGTLKALLEYRDKVIAEHTPGKEAAPPGG